jgi:hypothetical protein
MRKILLFLRAMSRAQNGEGHAEKFIRAIKQINK